MKTHKHLWDEFISAENFEIAAAHALRGKNPKYRLKILCDGGHESWHGCASRYKTGHIQPDGIEYLRYTSLKNEMFLCCPCIRTILYTMR